MALSGLNAGLLPCIIGTETYSVCSSTSTVPASGYRLHTAPPGSQQTHQAHGCTFGEPE